MFKNHKIFKTSFAGYDLIVETGKFAQLSNGSCLIRYGDTVIHVAVTASSEPRKGIDFFPLSVDFEEKLYAIGTIPGSYSKREGRPTEKAILISRAIDRPIRPLFPKDMRNDVAVVCTAMSVDPDCDPEVAAMIGASVALSISDIPWNGPISSVNVGFVNNQFVINPTAKQKNSSKMSVTVASTDSRVIMIEAGANEIDDETMFTGIMAGHEANQQIIDFVKKITSEIGKNKFTYTSSNPPEEMFDEIKNFASVNLENALDNFNKKERDENVKKIYKNTHEKFDLLYPENEVLIDDCLYKIQKNIVRNWLLNDKKRVDGRGLNEIRPLSAEVAILPRAHGSGLFTRGQTQVLTVATLGPISDQQSTETLDGERTKHYMHHYNFPSYSVGEVKPNRGPGRREIGHGALAERALVPVIPSIKDFPYTIRLVSEVLSSNGSTSQGSVCGSTLALMDAGVPIKAPVAGISCGLVVNGDQWLTMVDIQGLEDFFGDMDFKVAGTRDGITAIQMDIKIDGLLPEIIKEALKKTHIARNYILDEIILKTISKPRNELSKYAPKTLTTSIKIDKIRDVIGAGGKVVQKITADYNVKIDISDDGQVFVTGNDLNNCEQAINAIVFIAKDPEIGDVYCGKVTRVTDFGAFVEIAPGKEGLCHISQLNTKRVEKVTDFVNIGDNLDVKVVEIDEKGRLNLSHKVLLR